jgi:ABC-type sugar transport system ATPase subunit
MYDESREVLDLLGAHIDPDRQVRGLSMAVQQEIEIAKAITRKPRYIIFDEPSRRTSSRWSSASPSSSPCCSTAAA